MNDKFTNMNPEDADFADQLNTLSEQTHLDPRFANELERKLKIAHKPRTVWLKIPSNSILPSLGWVALVIVAGLALIWTIQNLVPKPQPATNQTPTVVETSTPSQDSVIQETTPDPNRPGYDFRGAKLIIDTTLPQSPAQANVFKLQTYQPASAEYAQTLASQFGIQGEIYTSERQYPVQSGFMVTDGKQQLVVYGLNDYYYTADIVQSSRYYNGFPNDNAETVIRDYLSSHGLDFNYRMGKSDLYGGYALQQISPDGLPMQFDSQTQPAMRITLTQDGTVLTINATMMNYDPAPIGSFGIISVDEALQMVLDDTLPAGKLETSAGGGYTDDFIPPQLWYREYPNDQTVTIFGNVLSNKSVDPSKPAIVFIDNVPAIGNAAGMENLESYTLVQATGQFIMDGTVRKFNVDSWKAEVMSGYLTGTVQRDGNQYTLTTTDEGKQYPIIDAPSDLPLDFDPNKSQLSFDSMVVDGRIDWRSIIYYPDASQMGGGGGGGGMGFYQLNLSGTPIPFPTTTPSGAGYTQAEIASFLRYTVQPNDTLSSIAATFNVSIDDIKQINNMPDEIIYLGSQITIPGVPGPTRLEGEPGTLMVNLFVKPDGRQRAAYSFMSQREKIYYALTGDNLETLQKLNGLPISVWGSITYDQYRQPSITVEKFEALYPDLQFQILSGTQEMKEVNGESLVLFASNGVTYVQMEQTGSFADGNFLSDSQEILIEGLLVPDETYAGYPTIRMFQVGQATVPATGERFEFPRSAGDLEPMPDPYGNADEYVNPDVVIETVELVYYATNPASQEPPTQGETYVQPAWHFRGRFSNGSILDVLVQALRQEYLSPEMDQNVTPG